jgi:tetratricopeptide (TPR) repeat protein
MYISEDGLKFFLYETHLLKKSVSIAHSIRDMGEEERKKINLGKNLTELFLFRVSRDPGFQKFVMSSLSHDGDVLRETRRYITKLICDYSGTVSSFYAIPQETQTNESAGIEKLIPKLIEYYDIDYTPYLTSINRKVSACFYQHLYRQSISDQDDLSATAIKTLKNLITDFNCFGKTPFLEDIHHVCKAFNRKRDCECRYYIYRNLKFPDNYIDSKRTQYELPLLRMAFVARDLRDLFAAWFNVPMPASPWMGKKEYLVLGNKEKSEFIQYSRFTNDVLFIGAEFWFNQFNEDDKLSLLNREYLFEVKPEDLQSLTVEQMDTYANELCDMGYYDCSLIIFLECLKHAEIEVDRFLFLDDIAYCYKNLGEFENAKRYYENAHAIITQYTQDEDWIHNVSFNIRMSPYSSRFLSLLTKKYIAEMEYHLGEIEIAEKRMEEALSELSLLNSHERIRLLHEIALAYKNTFNPSREEEILVQLLDEQDIDDKLFNYGMRRLITLNNCSKASGEHNLKKLLQMYHLERVPSIILRIIPSMNSFQFSRSLVMNQTLYELNLEGSPQEKEPLGTLAFSYFNIQNYGTAKKYFEQFRKECGVRNSSISQFAGYSGLCTILQGSEDEGIEEIRNEIALLSSILKGDKKGHAIGTLLNHVAKELLIYKKEGVSQIIETLRPEIEKQLSIEEANFYITSAYVSISWFTKAIEVLDNLIEEENFDENKRASHIKRKGDLYVDMGEIDDALSCYLDAGKSYLFSLPNRDRAELMKRMADAYIEKMNLIEAKKCIDTAQKLSPEDPELESLKQGIGNFLDEHISLESVKNRFARLSLKTAEREALELYRTIREDEEFDFSPPLGYYGKGLEILLDAEVWNDIRQKVFEKFSLDDYVGIPDCLYADLPRYWQGPLSRYPKSQKTVSLGTWERINLEKSNKHPVVDCIYSLLHEKFGDKFSILRDACTFLAPYRNDAFHKAVKGRDEVTEVRKTAIRHLNAVIHLLYDSDVTDKYNQLFKEMHRDFVLYEQSKEYISAGNDDQALELLNQAFEVDPTNTDVLVVKAQIFIRKREYDKAERCLEIALSLDEGEYDAMHEMGVLYSSKRHFPLAETWFQDAIRINPNHEYAWLNLGCTLMRMNDYSRALPCLKMASQINPDNRNTRKEIDCCMDELDKAQVSLDEIELRLIKAPQSALLHAAKGIMLYVIGNYSDALRSFDTALELGYDDPGLLLQKAQSLIRLNRADETIPIFQQCSAISKSRNERNRV